MDEPAWFLLDSKLETTEQTSRSVEQCWLSGGGGAIFVSHQFHVEVAEEAAVGWYQEQDLRRIRSPTLQHLICIELSDLGSLQFSATPDLR